MARLGTNMGNGENETEGETLMWECGAERWISESGSGKYSATLTTDHYAEAWVLVRGAG